MELKLNRTLTIEQLEELDAQTKVIEKKEPKKKAESRFHLPVLYLNDPTQWTVAEEQDWKVFTPEISEKVCVGGCCGVEGLKSACCHLDPENIEHVLGPLDEQWIKDIIKWFNVTKKIHYKREDIVIDYEEGKIIGETFFRGHEVFASQASYPMLRFQVTGQRFACKFISTQTGRCTIYSERPIMCRDYYCQMVLGNYLVKTREHPNRYVKLR